MCPNRNPGTCSSRGVTEAMVWRDARVLVTGASGFIGRYLAERLLSQGARVRVFARDPQRLSSALREEAEVCVGDLGVPSTLTAAVCGVDCVFHCAANVKTWDRAEAYERANVQGLGNLLDAIEAGASLPKRFVHVSTVDVYGFPERPCAESQPARTPGFGYGDSKLRGEMLLRKRAQAMGLEYVILRPANVMGPRSPFIERIGNELKSGLMLRIGRGEVDCGFLGVENLVDCLLWAGEASQAAGEIFNVRDPENIAWRRFLQDFREGIGGRGLVIDLPYWLACAAARLIESPYRLLRLRQEPLLHPLIVQIFGRTCGHRIDKLVAAGAPVGRLSYRQIMEASLDWYRSGERS